MSPIAPTPNLYHRHPTVGGHVGHIFLSHSTDDDAIARDLQRALGDHGLHLWIDSREMRGGDLLSPKIERAIDEADGCMILLSPSSLQSDWVGEELDRAIEVQKRRRAAAPNSDDYPVVPLSLDGTKLGMLKKLFGVAPLFVPISSAAGGVEAALDAILVALGKRAPADVAATPQPPAEPLEELVLELTDLKLERIEVRQRDAGVPPAQDHLGDPDPEDGAGDRAAQRGDGTPGAPPTRDVEDLPPSTVGDQPSVSVWRATARARLSYEPATPGQRPVVSAQSWRFTAPLGPIEADELRWYLEKYAIWPGGPFRDRARKVEKNLVAWGQQLYNAALPAGPTDAVLRAWTKVNGHAGRRFSVQVDARLDVGAPEAVATGRARQRRCCSACPGSYCTTVTAFCSRARSRPACVAGSPTRATSTWRSSRRRSASS